MPAAAIQAGLDRDVVEAASLYMSDEDNSLALLSAAGHSVPSLIGGLLLTPDGKSQANGSAWWSNPVYVRHPTTGRWNMWASHMARSPD